MTMEVDAAGSESAVPENVMQSVNRTLTHVQEVGANFDDFLNLCDPELLSDNTPIQRAQSLLTLSRLTTALFALRLRCAGIHPDDHRVKGELERISLYQDKLGRYLSLSKAPLRPSTKLNYGAATRVIEHSLPDLTGEQRRSLRELSKNESGRINHMNRNMAKKRKLHSSEKSERPSIKASAQEFLEKAALELLGDRQGDIKGPLAPIIVEDSSGEEELMEEQVENEVEAEDEYLKDTPASASGPITIDSSDGD